jgi:two-component system chemotaxis response regulator CheY
MRILVVDDDFVSRKKMEIIMQNFGDCDSAKNGEDAVGIFMMACESRSPYDVIALDISMPDVDGFEVLSKIREIEDSHNIKAEKRVKVIMVTAKSDKATVVECFQSGCNDYIVKPVNWKIVFNKLVKLKILKFSQ